MLLEGLIRKPDGTHSSSGILYVLRKMKLTPAPKDIPEEDLRHFYEREWEFKKDLLADFNKLTIAVAVAASMFFDNYPSVFYIFVTTCFVMIALYAFSYLGQADISKQYYKDSAIKLGPTYKSAYDATARILQFAFGIGIIVVLCSMIRAERLNLMSKKHEDDRGQKTMSYDSPRQNQIDPYKGPTSPQPTVPYNPPKTVPPKYPPPPPPK
jgi:hypothetical protein